MMDCSGSGPSRTGPITRRRAKALKLIENLTNRNFENNQQTNCAVPLELQVISNNKNPVTNRKDLADSKNTSLACEPVTTSNLNLLDILDNLVCRKHVLSYLQVGDLLRLRRVCQSTKEMSQDFIRMQKVSTQQPLKISFRDGIPFEEFNQFQNRSNHLPIRTSLHVTFCDRPPILNGKCNSNITHLTIFNPQLPFTKKSTLNFFESFPNVTNLVLDNIKAFHGYDSYLTIKIPTTFKNLKSLKIVDSHSWGEGFGSHNAFEYIKKLVEACIPNLELVSLPFHQFLWDYLVHRDDVVELACICIFSKTNLRLEGVTAELLNVLLRTEGRTPEMRGLDEMIQNINAKIVSIDRPDREFFLQELPNLEKINFRDMGDLVLPFTQPGFLNRVWPKLKKIKIQFDVTNEGQNRISAGKMWKFLFTGIVRENVVELHIFFSGFNQTDYIYQKRSRDILTTCPNLKILFINSLNWHPMDLPQLWRGLPRLEELHFDGYTNLEDYDFIGEDWGKPAFLELKSLKVLKFLDMDKMEVTNDLFSKVICQMPLKELHLSSNKKIKSITLNGIRSLLSGKFASTVERISIKGLKMKGVTQEQLTRLEKQFRSSQMY